MKKLSELQAHRIRSAYADLCVVLHELKRQTLSGRALERMKTLESVVQHLEGFKAYG